MFDLKRFLDSLVDENHPFRKGPNLWEGSALSLGRLRERMKAFSPRDGAWEEQQMRFYFMRINKN